MDPAADISKFLREVKTAGSAKDIAEQGPLPIRTALLQLGRS
jgi:hypothetical protein